MKTAKSLCLIVALGAWAGLGSAPAELRKFTMTSGETFDAEIIEADGRYVTFLRDGVRSGEEIADVTPADRSFIREWMRQNRGIYEWPGERGYRSDGSTDEPVPQGVAPVVLWRAEAGAGDAAVVVSSGVAVTTGLRDGAFVVQALDDGDGATKWRNSYPVAATAGRATATPSINALGGLVFSMGPAGRLDGWKFADGTSAWATEVAQSYAGMEFPADGVFGSPLASDRLLYVEIGGPSCSLVGISEPNGLEIWRIGKHRSLGATPVLAEVGGREVVVGRNQYGLVGRDAETGKMEWDHAWPGGGRASPLVIPDDRVFVTSADSCAMFQVKGDRTERLWSNSALCSSLACPVFFGGHLYGFNGETLTCVMAATGVVAWTKEGIGAGNLSRAAGQLLVQTGSSGDLLIVAADPAGYREVSRTKVFAGGSHTLPVLANGRIFCRSAAGDVTCLDVRPEN